MINVTKTFLPPREEYEAILGRIWESAWVTNEGPLQDELEQRLQDYLAVKHVIIVSSGTVALQLCLEALRLEGEIITTPFSYVATVNAILWQHCWPVFCDINDRDFCIDSRLLERHVTERTRAILGVHVYGNPCDLDEIERVAQRHRLAVIYDGAHAFGTVYRSRSLVSYGDVTTLSFHGTKVFHTIEGGAIVTDDDEIADRLRLIRSFGHRGDDYRTIGINAKNSEFHAAMGLCNLRHIGAILARRREVAQQYERFFSEGRLRRPLRLTGTVPNHAYYPVVFESESQMLRARNALLATGVRARRYFWPSLNTLPFTRGGACPESESIASRVLSLPTYYDLPDADVARIAQCVLSSL